MKRNAFIVSFLIFMLLVLPKTYSQSRSQQSINTEWFFHKGEMAFSSFADASKWEPVSVPHSWNTTDVMDDVPGYYRGIGMYKKMLYIPDSFRNRCVYLHFEGASQVAAIYINQQWVGAHTGSYTAFTIDISKVLRFDGRNNANEIEIKLDNSHNENIPPLSADFTFFGGLYRDVYIESLNKVHFDKGNYGSNGVFLKTPKVSTQAASVAVYGAVENNGMQPAKVKVMTVVLDKNGNRIANVTSKLTLKAGDKKTFDQQIPEISHPMLWSPEHPYLYQAITTISDESTNDILDEISNPIGFRWFEFTADKGFFLNGKHYKLWGASRHQDNENKGNALPDALHVKDVELLKEMGGNLLRVAHYPQDPAVLEACDRLGIIATVEIPVVNAITENDTFANNCLYMQTEMIRQNFNHPSVVIWAYMNEVLLRLRYPDDKDRQQIYISNIKKLALRIDSLTRKEDPSRYTMIPCHGDMSLYINAGLTEVPQVVGWNQYAGWYGNDITEFAKNMDRHQKELSSKPMIVTEYGADGDPRLRSFHSERFDKTIEYETYFHKVYIKAIKERPFISGAMVWNLADFNAEARREAMPHINNKGLLTIERKPKDVYRYYQSQIMTTPLLKIGSGSWVLRSGIEDASDKPYCTQPVEVYTNSTENVTLYLNGKPLGDVHPIEGVALFNVPFTNGRNLLEASTEGPSGELKDFTDITFKLIPQLLKDTVVPFQELNVSLGDKRFFNDDNLRQVWLPEQAYTPGSWGYIGGEVFQLKSLWRQPYGSDKDILGTDYDPIYETQREGIEQFKLDVAPSRYELTLLFAELLSAGLRDANVYNLDNGHNTPPPEIPEERSFDVIVNGIKVIEGLGNANYLIPDHAYNTKTFVDVKDAKGITIEFKALKGSTILNGLQLRKIY